jgi:hypothetical protein
MFQKKTVQTATSYGYWKNGKWNRWEDDADGVQSYARSQLQDDNEDSVASLFGTYEDNGKRLYIDNNTVSGEMVADEERASLLIEGGHAIIKTGSVFEDAMKKAFEHDDSPFKDIIKSWKPKRDQKGDLKAYEIQPKKKKFKQMKDDMVKLFKEYCLHLEQTIMADVWNGYHDFEYSDIKFVTESYCQLIGEAATWQILGEMEEEADFKWNSEGTFAQVFEFGKKDEMLGTVTVLPGNGSADIQGNLLVSLVKRTTDDMVAETVWDGSYEDDDYEDDAKEEEE